MALNVQTHPVQGEVVGLRHLLLVGRQGGLGLLDVEEVGFPQVNTQYSDQAAAEELNQGVNRPDSGDQTQVLLEALHHGHVQEQEGNRFTGNK